MDETVGRRVPFRHPRVGSIAAKDSFGPESGSLGTEERVTANQTLISFLFFFNNKTCPLLPSPLLKHHQPLEPYFPISQQSEKSLIGFNYRLSHDKALLCIWAAPR